MPRPLAVVINAWAMPAVTACGSPIPAEPSASNEAMIPMTVPKRGYGYHGVHDTHILSHSFDLFGCSRFHGLCHGEFSMKNTADENPDNKVF